MVWGRVGSPCHQQRVQAGSGEATSQHASWASCERDICLWKEKLRIDNSGWSVRSTAPINEVWTGCSQRTYYILHIMR